MQLQVVVSARGNVVIFPIPTTPQAKLSGAADSMMYADQVLAQIMDAGTAQMEPGAEERTIGTESAALLAAVAKLDQNLIVANPTKDACLTDVVLRVGNVRVSVVKLERSVQVEFAAKVRGHARVNVVM